MQLSVTDQMRKIMEDYSIEVIRATNNAQDDVAKQAVQKLKSTSPKRIKGSKHYARGWSVKRDRPVGGIVRVTIYNRTKPQLTHLLEHGHVIRNGKGEYGRAPAHPHIAPVEEWAGNELVREIERNLK